MRNNLEVIISVPRNLADLKYCTKQETQWREKVLGYLTNRYKQIEEAENQKKANLEKEKMAAQQAHEKNLDLLIAEARRIMEAHYERRYQNLKKRLEQGTQAQYRVLKKRGRKPNKQTLPKQLKIEQKKQNQLKEVSLQSEFTCSLVSKSKSSIQQVSLVKSGSSQVGFFPFQRVQQKVKQKEELRKGVSFKHIEKPIIE